MRLTASQRWRKKRCSICPHPCTKRNTDILSCVLDRLSELTANPPQP